MRVKMYASPDSYKGPDLSLYQSYSRYHTFESSPMIQNCFDCPEDFLAYLQEHHDFNWSSVALSKRVSPEKMALDYDKALAELASHLDK